MQMSAAFGQEHITTLIRKVAKWQGLSNEEQEEVVSGALAAIAERLSRGEVIADPARWLLRAAKLIRKKLVSESVARRKRVRAISMESLEGNSSQHEVAEEAPLQSLVLKALEKLRSNQREMVQLCDMHDTSPADAARELGMNFSTAISSLKRGRRHLSQDSELRTVSCRRARTKEHHDAN